MSSQQQIDANRRNAQRSTGPQTHEGRDAVRFNALRHGLTAKTAVLAGGNQEHFDEALEAFQAEYQPSGPTQNLLVQQMVMAAWRLARLRHIETGLFNLRLCDLAAELNRKYTRVPENGREAFVFRDDTINSPPSKTCIATKPASSGPFIERSKNSNASSPFPRQTNLPPAPQTPNQILPIKPNLSPPTLPSWSEHRPTIPKAAVG